MMEFIKKEDFDPQEVIPKLREKTNYFDYQTDQSFIDRVQDGAFLIFRTEHLLIPCEFKLFPTGLKTLEVNVVRTSDGGDIIDHIKETLREIEDFCIKQGIDRTILEGRIGWKRMFPDYSTDYITLYKEL